MKAIPSIDRNVITHLFREHGVQGSWTELTRTGVANHVYATRSIVLPVASDHPDAIADARTESVAAPVAYGVGVRTPRLLAFDDSRFVVDRPYSLWERVHALTACRVNLSRAHYDALWWAVGHELSLLHQRVVRCDDPLGYLDKPERDMALRARLERLAGGGRIDASSARAAETLLDEIAPALIAAVPARFLHNDVHACNVMCGAEGSLASLIDWGDAGWGDPTLEFAAVPLQALPAVIRGYEEDSPGGLGETLAERCAWDQLGAALEDLEEGTRQGLDVDQLRRLAYSDLRRASPDESD